MLPVGAWLQNRYHILSQLGGGGMGEVYLAEDVRLSGRRCAVKEMSPAQVPLQDRNWAIGAFQQEAEMLARLQHPGLTAVTDFFAEGGNWYLVMDYVQGETLDDRLQRLPQNCLPLHDVLDITRQLCDVLEYLHNQTPPVIFRDLKPGNVMVTHGGQVKLIDFGIARFFKPGRARDTVNLGTPGYAAPEQYGGKGQTDPRSDLYSLGVLLHQILTGYDPTTTPFHLPDPAQLGALVPPAMVSAIRRATLADPSARFSSVDEMRRAVFSVSAAPAPLVSRPSTLLVLAGVAAVLLLGGLGMYVMSHLQPTPVPVTNATLSRPPLLSPTSTPVTAPTEPPRRDTPVPVAVTVTPALPTVTPVSAASPVPNPGAPPQIVFYSNRQGNSDIYIMNADGSDVRQLTVSSGSNEFPVVSPEGRQIVFQSDRDGNWEIYKMERDGTNQTRLTSDAGQDRLPNWSPDGRQIIFTSDRSGNFQLYVVDADGRNVRRLTHNTRRDGHASWSGNGWIVFNAGDADNSATWEIYIMQADGTNGRQLTDNTVNDWSPNWSPDGRQILFLSRRGNQGEPAIWAMNADGSNPHLVYHDPGAYEYGAVWSPDSRSIAFTSNVAGKDDIYVLQVSSGRVTRLTSEGGMYPSWTH